MMNDNSLAIGSSLPAFLFRNSEMAALTRQYDWSRHPLGPIEGWSDSLMTSLSIVLNNKFPMFLFWGPELFCFYNDAFRPSLGEAGSGKHPAALGKQGREVWPEIWHIIGPQIDQVLRGGESIWYEDQMVPFYRNGKIEEIYWTYCYNAVAGRSGSIAGIIVTCIETTDKIAAQQNLIVETHRVRESEHGFRSLAENLPDIISRHDQSFRFTYANSRIEEYNGKKPEEVLGKSFRELNLSPEIASFFEQNIALVFESGRSLAAEFQNENGKYLEARFMPEFDDAHIVKSVLIIGTDISERKKTEQAFQDNKERLQAALDASLTGTFRWDILTNELSWDANLDRLFGLAPGKSVQSLDNFIERVHILDRQAVINQCQRCAVDGSDFAMVFRVVWPDGTVRWLDDNGKTYRNEAGKPIYMTGACVDVTETMVAHGTIEQSELRFRSTFENAAVGVAHVSLDGKWLLINDTLSNILGYSKNELTNLTFQEITHPDDLQEDLDHVADLIAGRMSDYSMEKRYIRKDKSHIWVNLTVSLQFDESENEPLYFIAIVQDISERKRAEDLLTETRNQLTQLSNFMPQMVWSTRADGYHDFYNQQWYDFVGLTYEDTKAEGWATVLHPDDEERTWKIWNESLQTGKLYETKYRMRRHDGQYRWLLARAMPFRNAQGTIVRWFGTCTDIHDQKAVEEQLEELVAERTYRLKQSNDDLLQFAHVTSHDLKEPLRKVRLFADQLNSSLATGNYELASSRLQKIDKSVARLFSMVEGVLEYSSVEASQVFNEPVDLNAVMKLIEFDLEFLFDQKKAKLTYESLPVVRGEDILVQRVFSNLIYNSLKFSHPDRDLEIAITAEKVINYTKGGKSFPGDYYKILVKDNGIGFSNEYAEKIFSPFTRLHSKDKYEGTGLGLALCRKIVERLDGLIEATGEIGNGATFTILLGAAAPLSQTDV
ncbi:PAS domain S-box protein [Chryseolinea sp. T2]|uniref:PAS domain-containing sensor histidine kinase n=1 Tax=Chryseolinea sp. T2 TaxID=3129255 RepID=UPI00307826B4